MSALPVHLPTPEPSRGVISWNMNTTCNYRCSYCTQRFLEDRGRWARDVPRFVDAFRALPGDWELKLSGGEPFVHPGFLDLVSALSGRGFMVSVVTNFSAAQDKLDAFLDAAGTRLGVMSCSLHLEYVNDEPGSRCTVEDFIRKARHVMGRMTAGASLCVTCVGTRRNLPFLPVLKERFNQQGITFKVQPEKQDRDVITYTPDEAQQLVQLGGHNLTGNIAPSFQGRPCWSGARYFIVDDRGNAFRCYPARRFRRESMGNLLDGTFHLAAGPTPCTYNYCNCTVPISRGMMPTHGAPDAFLRAHVADDDRITTQGEST